MTLVVNNWKTWRAEEGLPALGENSKPFCFYPAISEVPHPPEVLAWCYFCHHGGPLAEREVTLARTISALNSKEFKNIELINKKVRFT